MNHKLKTLAVIMLVCATTVAAQTADQQTVSKVFKEVGIDQHLGDSIPLDLTFHDESGAEVKLGEYFHDKPVVLSLVYYNCPMLCKMTLDGMVECFLSMKYIVNKDFDVVTVSFDPSETPEMAADAKQMYLTRYGQKDAASGWHFLTGDASSIKKLTEAVGFHYVYDPKIKQFAHATGVMVLTPEGKLSRYFYGVEYPARDMQFALIDASHREIGSAVDKILLLCYCYDPTTGKYGFIISNVLRASATLTILVMGGGIFLMLRKERKAAKVANGGSTAPDHGADKVNE
ncbi:MAG TPA: SCO family protein [Bacteroidota bacterium]|nr:SCO family protein [Bacteroidota bacterium]